MDVDNAPSGGPYVPKESDNLNKNGTSEHVPVPDLTLFNQAAYQRVLVCSTFAGWLSFSCFQYFMVFAKDWKTYW